MYELRNYYFMVKSLISCLHTFVERFTNESFLS